MTITEVRVYAKELPKAATYNMSAADVGVPESTIVEIPSAARAGPKPRSTWPAGISPARSSIDQLAAASGGG